MPESLYKTDRNREENIIQERMTFVSGHVYAYTL